MLTIEPLYFIISICLVIVLSYTFSVIAKRFNIPSVFLLITTGVVIKYTLELSGYQILNLFPFLEIVGLIGLIMIVLEATLDCNPSKPTGPKSL
ncbi:MAG: hypothetical protein WBG58_01540 [Ignavibacteriaceae bacterium]